MHDEYNHFDNKIIYVKECLPGPFEESHDYYEILENFNSQITQHCECKNFECFDERCSCIKFTGGANYLVQDELQVSYQLSDKNFDLFPILECNSLCLCSKDCRNRLVQKGPLSDLEIKDTGNKGLGLFTKKKIPKGTFVCEYAGEIITKATALKRQEENARNNKMNYIYCLNEYSNGKTMQTFIDPSYIGNIGRYINHSCAPNCRIIPVRVDTPIPKLAIFSRSDLYEGEELTFHYGSFIVADESSTDKITRRKCYCNSSQCTNFMPYNYYGNT